MVVREPRRHRARISGAVAVFVVAGVVAGCGGGGHASKTTHARTSTTSAQAPPPATAPSGTAQPTSLEQRAGWESYWYSLYNLASLSMGRSGMGIRFMPPTSKLMAMVKMAGLSKPPLTNPYLVSVPYVSGDPHFTRMWNPTDGATWRWNPKSFDTTVTPQSYAWPAIKYTEWAKNFENHKARPPLNHFRGLMLNTLAAVAAGWMDQHMRLPSGLFASAWKNGRVTDSTPRLSDQLAVLLALSSLETVADPAHHFAWYMAPLPVSKIRMMEDQLFGALERSSLIKSPSFADRALGVQALSWYAQTTQSHALRGRAVALALNWAKSIRQAQASSGAVTAPGLEPIDAQALLVRAEGQAALDASALGNSAQSSAARQTASSAWSYLTRHDWSAKAGLFLPNPGASTQTYTPGVIADLVGACNIAEHVLHESGAAGRYAVLFVNTIDRSHLIASQLPQTTNEPNGLPMPPKAGGPYGIAPVFRSQIAYDTTTSSWKVTNGRFTTAPALKLADELFWMGTWGGEPVKGPPALGLPYFTGSTSPTQSSAPSTSSTTTAAGGSASTTGKAVKVAAGTIPGLGQVLVSAQGRTLYIFAPDAAKKVTCTGTCATVWPPDLLSGGHPAATGPVKQSLLGSDPDPSGGQVATYAGWPLYTFASDSAPGQANGQALNLNGGLWYVISPAGTVIKKKR